MKYAIIKRTTKDAGLCSFLWTLIEACIYVSSKGYTPIITLKNIDNPTFYTNNKYNDAIYDYIKQPCGVGLYNIPFNSEIINFTFDNFWFRNNLNRTEKMIFGSKFLHLQDDIIKDSNDFINKNIKNNNVLGIRIRGTDYNVVKPKYHNIQPLLDDICSDIDFLCKKNNYDKIFVSTESRSYIYILRNKYGSKIITN